MKRFALAVLALFGLAAAVEACPPAAMVQLQQQSYSQVSFYQPPPVALIQTYFLPTMTIYPPQAQFQLQQNYGQQLQLQQNYGSMQLQQIQRAAPAKACGARRGILQNLFKGRRPVQKQRSVQRG